MANANQAASVLAMAPEEDSEALAFWMALFAAPQSGLSGAGRRLFAKNDFERVPQGFQWEFALRMAHGFSFREVEAAAAGEQMFNPAQQPFNEKVVRLAARQPESLSEAIALWPSCAIDSTQASYRAMALNGLTLPAHSARPIANAPDVCGLLLNSASVWAAVAQAPSNQIQKFAKRLAPWALGLKVRAAQSESDAMGDAKTCALWAQGLSDAARLTAARHVAASGTHGALAFQSLVAGCWGAAQADFGALDALLGSVQAAGANKKESVPEFNVQQLRFLKNEFVAALLPAALRCVCPTALLGGAGWAKEEAKELLESAARRQIISQWGAMPDIEKNLPLWVAEAEKTQDSLGYNEQHAIKQAFEVAQAAAESFIAQAKKDEIAGVGKSEARWDALLEALSAGFFNAHGRASLSGAWAIHLAVGGAKKGLGAPVFFERAEREWERRMLESSEPGAHRAAAIFRAARESIEIAVVARETRATQRAQEVEDSSQTPSATKTSRRL